jgi:hypothetical protein
MKYTKMLIYNFSERKTTKSSVLWLNLKISKNSLKIIKLYLKYILYIKRKIFFI